jgi:adenylate kinase
MNNRIVSLSTTRSFTVKKSNLTFSTKFSAEFINRLNTYMSGRTVVFIGGPAAGKGTKIEALGLVGLKFRQLSTGDALRAAVKDKTVDGLKAESYMQKGENVPDLIVNRIVVDFLKGNGELAVFLDGYPREVEQARFLMDQRGEIFVIDIRVSLETALKQSEERRNEYISAGKPIRTDDEAATVIKRYRDYTVFSDALTIFFNAQKLEKNMQVCESSHRDLSIAVDTIITILASWFMPELILEGLQ